MKMEVMAEEKLRGGDLDMPGFRFHPTEEELVGFYLRKKAQGQKLSFEIIGTLDLYKYDPWQLPGRAFVGEKEWFFFVPCDNNCSSTRRSRLTASGYWKATGSDRAVRNQALQCIGIKKTLVFYIGKAPRGDKTDWIMNEYRMPGFCPSIKKDVVLCRIYRKATSHKSLEQRAMADQILKGGKAIEKSLESSSEGKASSMNGCQSNGIMESGFSQLNCHHDHQAMEYRSLMDVGLSSSSSANKSYVAGMAPAFTRTSDKESKFKPTELQVPKVSMDNMFIQSVVSPRTENAWTPSLLLSTPKDWISDGAITIPSVLPLKTISPCKVERPMSFV